MSRLTIEMFNTWLDRYGNASKENNPMASAELFTLRAKYFVTPFNEPLVGRAAIYGYWETGANNFINKQSSFEILSVRENIGIARWMSQFTKKATGEQLALDCIFLVEFDEDGKCQVFREWWHLQTEERQNHQT